jgi:N-acetyl-anhydromuramyl-L-alanine amidase AmpD
MLPTSLFKEFEINKTHKAKKQIILCHTSREVEEYLTSLKFRYNGKYDKIPHYVVKKDGDVLQLLENFRAPNFFYNEKINNNSIIISLENLGWLERKPLSSDYINWKGSIYRGTVYEKKWRDYFFWDVYPEKQFESLVELCFNLCYELQIEKRCSGHNTKMDGMINFEGIASRSNFDSRFTDLSPSFNFENFLKKIEHGNIS